VNDHLEKLREHAFRLRFDVITGRIDKPIRQTPHDFEDFLAVWAGVAAEPYGESTPKRLADVNTARGFVVFPGRGCEAATFGFLHRATIDGRSPEWHWQACCKTQYASVVSEDHFIYCHTALVELLDHAVKLGIGVVVHDEGHYWETRDTGTLLEELRYMNRLVARVAGRMSDAMPGNHSVKAAIFEHPEFERLEVERDPRARNN
jgi:hypothetical protein